MILKYLLKLRVIFTVSKKLAEKDITIYQYENCIFSTFWTISFANLSMLWWLWLCKLAEFWGCWLVWHDSWISNNLWNQLPNKIASTNIILKCLFFCWCFCFLRFPIFFLSFSMIQFLITTTELIQNTGISTSLSRLYSMLHNSRQNVQ